MVALGGAGERLGAAAAGFGGRQKAGPRRIIGPAVPSVASLMRVRQPQGSAACKLVTRKMASQFDLDQFLRRGPVNGDVVQGLAELRYKVLLDGIASNGDGMVCLPTARSAARR